MKVQSKSAKEQIVASALSVTYFPGQSNEVKSLDNINFTIYEGEFIIFFGPSGCGKSTMLYSIANLETFQGSITVDGKKINELDTSEKVTYHRDNIGLVFQAYQLIPTLSVVQNVALPLISIGLKATERIRRAMELLARFSVETQAEKLPNELSGGQQQRVAICRAVVNNPKILLADEPLGNLDSKSADEVMHLFKDINERLGKTVVLVTHDPTYLNLAHRVFYIKDGKLVDIKVNRAVGGKSTAHLPQSVAPTASPIPSAADRAKHIASLALTGYTPDEISSFEHAVEQALAQRSFKDLESFLDVDPSQGGLGLDKRTVAHIREHVTSLAKELDGIDELLAARRSSSTKELSFRKALFTELDITLKHQQSYTVVDSAIIAHVKGKTDTAKFFTHLHTPLKKGGAGIDKRIANKIVKHVGVMLAGKLPI